MGQALVETLHGFTKVRIEGILRVDILHPDNGEFLAARERQRVGIAEPMFEMSRATSSALSK